MDASESAAQRSAGLKLPNSGLDGRESKADAATLRSRGRPTFDAAHGRAADRFDAACSGIRLDSACRPALWRQLADQLETVIRRGDLEPGARIPSEEALATRFGVSRPVVRNALQALAVCGLVVKLPRKGIFIGEPRPETAFITTNLAAYDDLVARGHKVTAIDFEINRTAPSTQECDRLQLEPSDSVVRIGRVFWMDGEPISHARIAFHGGKVPGLEHADLENRPILRYLQERYGRRLSRAERWFKAALPPADIAARMRVTTSTPMIWVESVAYEADNSPLEYYQAYYNSELALIHLSILG